MKKVLIIRYKKSRNVLEGGEQGSQKNLRMIQRLFGENDVDTYYIHDETRPRHLTEYALGIIYFPFDYYFGLTPSRVQEICSLANGYENVFIDRSVFGIIARELKGNGYKGRVITFFHNVERDYFAVKYRGNLPGQMVVRCADRNDRLSCQYSDRIVVLNDRDSDRIYELYGRRAEVIIPVAFADKCEGDIIDETAMTASRPSCLFLGAYFPGNVRGIEWFAEHVLPHVDIRMIIAGKGMDKIRTSPHITADIEVMSDVLDLAPLFRQTDIMILPIFEGSGMKVKTCESLMYGKNIIATDEALVGYDVDDNAIGARANTAEEFIAAIHKFQENPRLRFNKSSRETYLAKYSENSVFGMFEELFRA